MEFTEELVKKHFNKAPHINVDWSTFDAYLSKLTLRNTYYLQINIHHNDGSWDDIFNSMPEASFVPVGLGVRWDHGTVSDLWWQSQQLRARAWDGGDGMEGQEGWEEEQVVKEEQEEEQVVEEEQEPEQEREQDQEQVVEE